MPTFGFENFYDGNIKHWEWCKREATRTMVASGWKIYANKFDRVMLKKAKRLWDTA